jgi:SHS2 domain-containing protein
MDGNITLLEHPSDLGIEARGATLCEAFQNAAVGLMSVILDLSSVAARDSRELELSASDEEQLLVRWLSEVLYLYDGQGFVGKEFVIEYMTETNLKARVLGEQFSAERHSTKLDVKAITYHQILVHKDETHALVRVFLDI